MGISHFIGKNALKSGGLCQCLPAKSFSVTFKFFMPSVHTCFIQPTKKKILANTDLTPTTAVYVIVSK